MSKTEIIKNRENLLCEIFSIANKCKYTIYPGHISFEWGGMENEVEIDGAVICASSEDADRCVESIACLVNSGCGENSDWYVDLDIIDIVQNIFNGGVMLYFHTEIYGGINPAVLEKLREALVGSKTIFVCFHMHKRLESMSVDEILAQIVPEGTTDLRAQVSVFPGDVREFVEIWYK